MLISLVLGLMAACSPGCGASGSTGGAGTATPPPTVAVTTGGSPLTAARFDAAARLHLPPQQVALASLRAAGWDGCLGVVVEGQPCSQLFVAGEIAIFAGAGQQLRYHIAGSHIIGPVDPAHASDGSPLQPDDVPDLEAPLAAYAADDFAMVNNVPPETVTVVAAWPAASTPNGALLKIQDSSGDEAVYAVTPSTGIVRQTAAAPPAEPPPEVASVELAMRQQLAQKLGEDVAKVSILSYRLHTWPNGCAGLEQPGTVCAQVVTPGFEALLSDASGRQFAFRGAGQHFGIVAP